MKPGFKLALITLPIAAIGAGILAFVVSNSPPPERVDLGERASAVRVVTAETKAITPTLIGFGVVAPAHTFEAIAEVGGTVEYVNPDLRNGRILPAGTVLLRLSPTDFNLAIAQANANIRSGEARLAELAVAETNQRDALDIEREALAVKAADLARAEKLFAAGTMAQIARDGAQAAHLAQRQKVQAIQSTLALFPTQRTVQVEQIAVFQATLATAELSLQRSELTLPFAARVASNSVEVGQFLKTGQTAATLDGIGLAEIELQVSMSSLRSLLRTGIPAAETLPTDPLQMNNALQELGLGALVKLQLGDEVVIWPAKVDRISDGVDQSTGTIGVIVQVQAAYGQAGSNNQLPLSKGMFVDVVLSTDPVSGIVLPRSALREGRVFVVDADNRLRIITAKPQLVQGGIVLFSDSIADGARVLISPPSPVIEGLLLDPFPDTNLMTQLLAEEAAR